jgi:hypothetical protein
VKGGWFRQSGVTPFRLVVEPVETHQRVTPTVGRLLNLEGYIPIILTDGGKLIVNHGFRSKEPVWYVKRLVRKHAV